MPTRWISIAGSVSPEGDYIVPNPDDAVRAAEELGRELAKAGCGIVVYSDGARYVDRAVVRGYVASGEARPESIQVQYPNSQAQPRFDGQAEHIECFLFCPDQSDEWEVSSYRALHEVDGIVIIGGGRYSFISGLVAMGLGIPILALAGFGGASAKIWKSLLARQDGLTKEEIYLMGHRDWQADSAAKAVKTLIDQDTRRKEEKLRREAEQLQRSKSLLIWAIVAAILFAAAIMVVPFTWENSALGFRWMMMALMAAPLLSGTSGATIRTIFDLRLPVNQLRPQSAGTTAALGLVAGGVAGLLFILAQMTAMAPDASEIQQIRQASRLVPFATIAGFLAGFTLDAVFKKLTEVDIVRTEALSRTGASK